MRKNQTTPHNEEAKRRAASPGRAEDVVGSAVRELQEKQRILGGTEEQQRWQMQETEREAQKWAVRWNLLRGLLGRRRRSGCDMRRTERYNCLKQEKDCVGLSWRRSGKDSTGSFCTGANAVLLLVRMSDANGSLGRSSGENLG